VIEELDRTDDTLIRLQLSQNEETLKLWAYTFRVILEVVIGRTLSLSLHITNTDTKPFKVSTALHTYLSISDIHSVRVEGLENTEYYDALRNITSTDNEVLAINSEIDRIYNTSAERVILKDINNSIMLKSKGSNSLVVWNPWKEKSEQMDDMADDSYENLLCLETANARDDARWIEPDKTHTLVVEYIQAKVR
jgi:glucose-6-phosphate 1-epimerase